MTSFSFTISHYSERTSYCYFKTFGSVFEGWAEYILWIRAYCSSAFFYFSISRCLYSSKYRSVSSFSRSAFLTQLLADMLYFIDYVSESNEFIPPYVDFILKLI